MHALRSVLKQAQQMRAAVGHFNVAHLREEFDFPIFLDADHKHSLVKAVELATGESILLFPR